MQRWSEAWLYVEAAHFHKTAIPHHFTTGKKTNGWLVHRSVRLDQVQTRAGVSLVQHRAFGCVTTNREKKREVIRNTSAVSARLLSIKAVRIPCVQ